jgi:hypothetical protein
LAGDSAKKCTRTARQRKDESIDYRNGRRAKTVVAIVAGIFMAKHLDTVDDLSGGPQGIPRTEKVG